MSAIYCSNCGVKHSYTYAKPKFCSSCGSPLGAEVKKAAPQKQEYVEEDDYDDEDGDSSNQMHVPNLRKIEVDVEQYQENSSFTLGSLFGDNSQNASKRRRRTQNIDDFISEKPRKGE
jgi:ribosomal protein L37E